MVENNKIKVEDLLYRERLHGNAKYPLVPGLICTGYWYWYWYWYVVGTLWVHGDYSKEVGVKVDMPVEEIFVEPTDFGGDCHQHLPIGTLLPGNAKYPPCTRPDTYRVQFDGRGIMRDEEVRPGNGKIVDDGERRPEETSNTKRSTIQMQNSKLQLECSIEAIDHCNGSHQPCALHFTVEASKEDTFLFEEHVKISLKQENDDVEKTIYNEYYFAGGLVEYVKWLNQDKKPIHEPILLKSEKDGIGVDVALQWCSDAYSDTLLGYANSIRTSDGGTHMDGLKASLTRTLNNLGRKSKIIKEKDENLGGEHVREGLTAIVSVKISNPEFEGQTKTRLGNPEVRKVVDQAVHEYFTEYLECNPEVLDSILSKALNAFKAAMAAKKARELVRRKTVLTSGSSALPGKLADCSSSDPHEA
ncbi:hypothetical protein KI387_024291, partial [Taxus chinensis]